MFLSPIPSGALWASSSSPSLQTGVPVEVFDELGLARKNELVQVLVPFPSDGSVHDPNQILLAHPNGREVAVQWRTLQRWNGVPTDVSRPIRFALAQFRVNLAAGETCTYTARYRMSGDGFPKQPKSAIQVYEEGPYAVVDTGAIRVGLDTSRHQLFGFVETDLNGDGVIAPGERVLDTESNGAILISPLYGANYGLLDNAVHWEVEESGPLKLVVRADGLHQPNFGGIGRDYFGFTTRYTFEAGSAAVRVEHVLKNSYLLDPLGHMSFARYLLHTHMAGTDPLVASFGGEEGFGTSVAVDLSMKPSAFVYQDSSGAAHWNQPGTTFAGWRVYDEEDMSQVVRPEALPTADPIASGQHSSGWMNVEGESQGMLISLRYPWQNYPFALRAYASRDVIADLWPAEFAGVHWLDDATRKAHHLIYRFHAANIDPSVESLRLTHPLVPVIDLAYLRATKAWADQGDLRDPELAFSTMQQHAAGMRAEFYKLTDLSGGFGWENFGEGMVGKNTHSTGSPRNKLSYFERYMASGVRAWFEVKEVFALHSMDLRSYHLDGFTKQSFPNAHMPEGVPHYTGYDMLGRDQISSLLDPYKVGVPKEGKGWNGYDAEHMSVDDLYEYYLLTGSFSALDALVKIGEGIKTWKMIHPSKPIPSSRAIGWTLRALIKIYQVTGDMALLQKAKDVMEVVHKFRGQDPGDQDGPGYHYLARSIYGKGQHGMTTEYDLPWQIAVGMYGIALYYRETSDPSVPGVLGDLSEYLVDYCVVDDVVVDALSCDDHLDFNPNQKNNGVNAWIPSALAIAYRLTGDKDAVALAAKIYEENASSYEDSPKYSWFHTVGEVLENGE